MNLHRTHGLVRALMFRIMRAAMTVIPGGRIMAFGPGKEQIGSILVINLDRKPDRWKHVTSELERFQTSDGASLASIAKRLSAVDARDGRAVAATADVDPNYCIGNQLYVQPDERLQRCFGSDEPVKMSRQEVAVARSHVEVWKAVATGSDDFVLVLEDDVWFRHGAAGAIDRGWRTALQRCRSEGGPQLLYLSYADAGGTAERADVCDALFRPLRGLWFLSGYVLSRTGAAALLRAMPVVGPADTWMNYRFKELGALALSEPAILQRQDSASDNSYSVLPYLARAGIVDAGSGALPTDRTRSGPLLAWTSGSEREGLAMALSMLGLRVRAFSGDEKPVGGEDLQSHFDVFDALVDLPLGPGALSAAIANPDCKFIVEAQAAFRSAIRPDVLPPSRTVILSPDNANSREWEPLCSLLSLVEPVQPYPTGAPREWRLFRSDRPTGGRRSHGFLLPPDCLLDDSPWVLPPRSGWQATPVNGHAPLAAKRVVQAAMTGPSPSFPARIETFPGNLASFAREGLKYDEEGAHIIFSEAATGGRPYRSGAFASSRLFDRGRFQAEIKAARGSGLITGFFLHRDAPRQEIDIELAGGDPRRMLVNVYFNPGDDGTTMGFGYRGTPSRIDLDFDATVEFHLYAIEWQPGRIAWSVDGRIVHERLGWDPTPIPHLPMRLHANLWAPRSQELVGRLDLDALPSTATFRNLSVLNISTLEAAETDDLVSESLLSADGETAVGATGSAPSSGDR